MTQRVLSVGNCAYDQSNLQRVLKQHFRVEIDSADDAVSARKMINENDYNIVLINRVFDSNNESGIEFIKQLKKNESEIPVMLISNFDEYQQQAMAEGAVQGFGKSSIGRPEFVELMMQYLN